MAEPKYGYGKKIGKVLVRREGKSFYRNQQVGRAKEERLNKKESSTDTVKDKEVKKEPKYYYYKNRQFQKTEDGYRQVNDYDRETAAWNHKDLSDKVYKTKEEINQSIDANLRNSDVYKSLKTIIEKNPNMSDDEIWKEYSKERHRLIFDNDKSYWEGELELARKDQPKKERLSKTHESQGKKITDTGYGSKVGKVEYATVDEANEAIAEKKAARDTSNQSSRLSSSDNEIKNYKKALEVDPYNKDAAQNLKEANAKKARLNKRK